MSTYLSFYQSLANFVTATCPHLSKWAKARLVWFIWGLLIRQSVVFSRIAQRQVSLSPHSLQVASCERRLRRIATDPQLDWNRAYKSALQAVLGGAAKAKRLIVLVDETSQQEHYRVLVSAVWYRGRAIPLAWQLRGNTEGEFWEKLRELLAQTAQVLPRGVPVVVVGDRAFGTPAFTDLVASLGWDWLVRLQGQTLFKAVRGQAQPVKEWLEGVGSRRKGAGQLFKKQGWRRGSLVGVWGKRYQEPLLLGSSLAAEWEVVRWYKYRYAIEALFRDFKSGGFEWEKSQVRELGPAEKVVLGLSWGVLVAIVLGEAAAEEELARAPTGKRHTRPPSARFSLVYLGKERVMSYLVGKVREEPQWELGHWEAERWHKQIHQHHAKRFIATSLPREEKGAA